MSTIIQLRIVIVLLRWFTTAINIWLLLQSIHASHHQFQHLVHLSRQSFNFFYGQCRVFNYCRVWFCATITVTTARLVLRNNNRYKGIIVAVPGHYNEFYFDVRRMWSEGIYEGPHSFPQSFFRLTLRGRGGLLSFGVNLRVLSILSVYAFVVFRAKVHTDNFIKWIH